MADKIRQAVILVGGFGTRLLPLTRTRPKPVMPVLDRPFLHYLIQSMAEAGITEVILACGYKSDVLAEKLGNGQDLGITISYVDEDTPLGTAGAIKNIESRLDPVFVASNGDTLNFVDVKSQIETHLNTGADVTLSLSEMEDVSSYGVVVMDDTGRITAFQEKPKPGEEISHMVNTGLYVMNRSILSFVPENTFFDLSKDLYPILLKEKKKMQGHPAKGIWIDIGKPHDLIMMNQVMADTLYKNRDWNGFADNSMITGSSYIGKESTLDSSVLTDSIISRGCTVKDSKLKGTLIMEKCTIQEKCRLGSLFDKKCGGGCIAHINIENRFQNEETAWDMLNYVASQGVIYFAFTTKISVCEHKHAFISEPRCPICGEPIADTYARVVGFYTPTSSYQKIRKREFDARKWMNVLSDDGVMR